VISENHLFALLPDETALSFVCLHSKMEIPVKLTPPEQFKLTPLLRSKLTPALQSKLTPTFLI